MTDLTELRSLQGDQLAHAEEREIAARRKAEDAEERRHEAEERRRAQELLIDVTFVIDLGGILYMISLFIWSSRSHELRQPVSAILNCASLVRSNLIQLREDLNRSLESRSAFQLTPDTISVMDEDLEALG